MDAEAGCAEIMQLLTAARGAINSLMAEVVEDHIRMHMVDPKRTPTASETEAAEELVGVLHSYIKIASYSRVGGFAIMARCIPPAMKSENSCPASVASRVRSKPSRALDGDGDATEHLIAGTRGALAGLMAEVVEDHVRTTSRRCRQISEGVGYRGGGATSRSYPDISEMSDMMAKNGGVRPSAFHKHVFLSEDHAKSERKTWAVIWLCGVMMFAEIAGGLLFGSIALIADGLHMSTHAGALLLAALAYSYARKHADDPNYTFGTGKARRSGRIHRAIILAMIALLIGYESVSRIFTPVAIHFAESNT